MTTKELRALTQYAKQPRGPYKLPNGQTIGCTYFPFPWPYDPETKKPAVRNRKARRFEKAAMRRHSGWLPKRTLGRQRIASRGWFLRIVREMKGNREVESRVVNGALDKYLPTEGA